MWNILDTLVLCVDVVIVAGPIVFSSIWNWYFQRAINVLVSLRMFRVLSRNTKMQRLVVSVTQTLPSIGSVIKLTFAIFLAFAIVGVRIFGGKFGFCEQILAVTQSVSSSTYITKRLDIDQYSCDLREDTYWNSPKYDFDWIGSALLTLFETASLDGWIDIMHHAMDIGGNKNANWPACLFFITFILCGSFMMIRTIIGVFIDRFGISSGLKLLTERQKLWRDMHGVAMSIKPMRAEMKPVVGSVRRKCYDAIHSKMFKKVILILLSLNIVLLATVTSTPTPRGSTHGTSATLLLCPSTFSNPSRVYSLLFHIHFTSSKILGTASNSSSPADPRPRSSPPTLPASARK